MPATCSRTTVCTPWSPSLAATALPAACTPAVPAPMQGVACAEGPMGGMGGMGLQGGARS
eukprot:scaffold40592_cov63-Phaeocystis_antarctica.AAC.5